MELLDIFSDDAFSAISLTERANNPDIVPHVPGRLGELGLFAEVGIRTETVAIERRDNQLQLVQSVPRGAPPKQGREAGRTLTPFLIPHLPYEDHVKASEVQGVRQFGEPSGELEAVQEVVDDRMATMTRDMDATLEHLRMSALNGVILDADGSTIYDLFSEFGLTPPAQVDFELDVDTTDVRGKCSALIRDTEDALGNATYTGMHSFCSASFFDALVDHAQVREAYDRWMDGEFLRMRTARRMFAYAGIMFEEYRGKVGGTDFVADGEARFFPIGANGVFVTHFAPGDFIETVNTVGLPRYAKQEVAKFGRGVDVLMESNPLPIVTRPEALRSAIAS